MQRTGSGLGLVGTYGADDESDEESMNTSATNKDGVDTISGSDDEGGTHHKEKAKPEKRPHAEPQYIRDESPKRKQEKRAATKLVSYGPDDVDEDSDDDKENEDHDDDMEESDGNDIDQGGDENSVENRGNREPRVVRSLLHGDIQLPPEPQGRCSRTLQDKIAHLARKVYDGYNLSQSMQNRKDFRNPAIYEKLIDFCSINEKGTNYPPELFNPAIWGPESYYDELAKAQKVEMDKREAARKERTKVEFISGTKKESAPEPKRKSKWDSQPAVLPPGAHVPPPPPVSITTAATGTKGTIIPAVGSITKKK